MGAKWFKVQKITTDFDVQIKFPDETMENGGEEPINHMNGDGRSANPNIIKITGRTENCALAAQALLELVPVTTEVVLCGGDTVQPLGGVPLSGTQWI